MNLGDTSIEDAGGPPDTGPLDAGFNDAGFNDAGFNDAAFDDADFDDAALIDLGGTEDAGVDCLPAAEACNGIDDDCDGEIDNGELCLLGQACVQGACVGDQLGPPGGRSVLMQCGRADRDVTTFIDPARPLEVVEGCRPDAHVQALLVTHRGLAEIPDAAPVIQEYVRQGGRVITESSASDEVFEAVFGGDVEQGRLLGDCGGSISPQVRLGEWDLLWQAVSRSIGRPGCGHDLSTFPGISPLGSWGQGSVSLGYRDFGDGRLWLVEADWQGLHVLPPASMELMTWMIYNPAGPVVIPLGGDRGFGHHGACDTFNGCGDAQTCAQAACGLSNHGEVLAWIPARCQDAFPEPEPGQCNLFRSIEPGQELLDDRWPGDCNMPIAQDVVCQTHRRSTVQLCGRSERPFQFNFLKPSDGVALVESCVPDANTQALAVTRTGQVDPDHLRQYLQAGGIVITEFNNAHTLFNAAFGTELAPGLQRGRCRERVNPVIRLNEDTSFWQINGDLPSSPPDQSGCGADLSDFPGITRLGGWDAHTTSLAYRDLGQGRLWLVASDWQGNRSPLVLAPASRLLMRHMLFHRR